MRAEIVLGKTGLGPWVLFSEIKIAEIDRDRANGFEICSLL